MTVHQQDELAAIKLYNAKKYAKYLKKAQTTRLVDAIIDALDIEVNVHRIGEDAFSEAEDMRVALLVALERARELQEVLK